MVRPVVDEPSTATKETHLNVAKDETSTQDSLSANRL